MVPDEAEDILRFDVLPPPPRGTHHGSDHHTVRARLHRRRGGRGRRPERQARDRHRRRLGHRHRDRPRAGRCRRRGHARRPRRRRPASASPPTSRPRTGNATSRRAASTSPTRPRSPPSSTAWDGPLHMLVNNAGVMATARAAATARGLGAAVRDQPPRPLRARRSGCTTRSPRPAARGSSRSAPAATCARRSSSTTSTSSAAPYDPWSAYGQSKTANVLFAVEATRRWADDGITANALMPGRDHDQPPAPRRRGHRAAARVGGPRLKTPEQGAATSVLLAASPLLEGIGGRYFEDCNEAPRRPRGLRGRRRRARVRDRSPRRAAAVGAVGEHARGAGHQAV